jgi:hypothetical protein
MRAFAIHRYQQQSKNTLNKNPAPALKQGINSY